MESFKIKEKILNILDTDKNLILTMLNYFNSYNELNEYFNTDEYSIKYKKLETINDPFKKSIENDKLNSKGHWIFKCIDTEYLSNKLFLNKEDDLISDEKIKKILTIIIVYCGKYENIIKDKSFSSENKNLPATKKKNYIKTINDFKNMIIELELGGKYKYYKEKKDHYNINEDEAEEFFFDTPNLCKFLDDLKNEIILINGNDKTTFCDGNDFFHIKNKFYNPKIDGLRKILYNDLQSYCECDKNNLTYAINNLEEFIKKEILIKL
jgi:hypothetical protein